MSDSDSSCWPSEQLDGWQRPCVQGPSTQSTASRHGCPSAHLDAKGPKAHPPPQSTPVSVPFVTPSVHVATRHDCSTHTPLWQSLGPAHIVPSGHFAHTAPPQSMDDSSWLRIESALVGARHRFASPQLLLTQSLARTHVPPVMQDTQMIPPQSMSVSSWFTSPSAQVGATQSVF